ncbi:hypothetical protein DICVIV_03338 [Dictyocaulus viviparus]|uniref:Uncharacterized protein n=1 Tax=Dictyocaulus viviparus TaxID=29172 RepID=A0A0D8Y0U0_DICVI|nr:hypothetical protein DICVIV_03338 [Dictyocaulus viviparus]
MSVEIQAIHNLSACYDNMSAENGSATPLNGFIDDDKLKESGRNSEEVEDISGSAIDSDDEENLDNGNCDAVVSK